MNSRAFSQEDLFEQRPFCLSGTSPADKKALSPCPLCLCGEYEQLWENKKGENDTLALLN
jgi:hypothetical protein